MSAEELAALLSFATAMSFTPGPNTTLSTALGANLGLRRALPFIVAVPAGWTLMMLLCGLGLAALVLAAPVLRLAVKFGGIAYLVWMAWKLAAVRTLGEVDARQLDVGFWQGVGLQFLNIKAWMLALALAAGWVTSAGSQPAANPGERLAIVCAVMVVFALTSNFSYALAGSLLRGWLAQGRRLLVFNRVMAAVLLATAIWLLGA
ncbi:MAG TPA: LysE family transporter [Piscinibacter sp.]|jgi:threonine/homoserine/homoserine lactone efflux protein|uniref:LysE family translocator n=1 Tax=Piscinibacter sp. TaxID=1903157 RepID=UPI001B43DF91|nr:LysE family transporter [Piscinibacter sp.]MBK7532204.1 LysE family transporter [Piscinibacter sp.]MBL0094756.1 LysE family transporter [Piscinibacter sp.]MBP6542115.1 LysE family transporter [Piscinibacter sp.]HOY37034.1 LysE family transporter [Piscinibacter sp.]HPG78396.1 LysE family transporter [Piscinibacter sp.]